jgi:hypothetical protein
MVKIDNNPLRMSKKIEIEDDEKCPEWYTYRDMLREDEGLSEDDANREADAEFGYDN